MPDDDSMLGQNEVDVRNEARREYQRSDGERNREHLSSAKAAALSSPDVVRQEEILLHSFSVALSQFDTETLLAIADYRDEIDPDGWYQTIIRDFVEEWR